MENIIEAFASISSNKLRSGLSMLGIIIGVFSVIVMIAIGKGAQAGVTSSIQQLGSNLLLISPGSQTQSNVRSAGQSSALTNDDLAAIIKNTPLVTGISAEYSGRKQLIYQSNNVNTTVDGVLPAYETVNSAKVAYGRFLTDQDQAEMNRVIVLGSSVATNLFPDGNPIGADIRVENNIFTVVGVLQSKGQQGFRNADDMAYIPLSTAQKRVFGNNNTINTISVSVENIESIDQVKNTLEYILMREHRIKTRADENFTILNQQDAINTLNSVTQIFTLLLGGIASISLIVGGIGVMNIMLVSVTERTKEIGIRKAIGAHNRDILLQFLNESVLLSVISGSIGVLLGIGVVYIVKTYLSFPAVVTISSIVLAFVFSVSIGVFFGIFPAYKASKLKPIDALRFE